MSEVESQGSRHRRRSVPSFASSLLGGRGRREGSVDPLLEGFQSDGGDSGGRNSNSTFHRSVSRGDLDAMDRFVDCNDSKQNTKIKCLGLRPDLWRGHSMRPSSDLWPGGCSQLREPRPGATGVRGPARMGGRWRRRMEAHPLLCLLDNNYTDFM